MGFFASSLQGDCEDLRVGEITKGSMMVRKLQGLGREGTHGRGIRKEGGELGGDSVSLWSVACARAETVVGGTPVGQALSPHLTP